MHGGKNTFIGICVNVEKIGKLASGFVTVPQVKCSSGRQRAEAPVSELIKGSTSATEGETRHIGWPMKKHIVSQVLKKNKTNKKPKAAPGKLAVTHCTEH